MRTASQQYKDSIMLPLRNEFEARVTVGLVSVDATSNATIGSYSTLAPHSSPISNMLKPSRMGADTFATYELNTFRADGRSLFYTPSNASAGIYDKRVIFNEVSNASANLSNSKFTVTFPSSIFPIDLPAITIDFDSENFATEIQLTFNETTKTYTNDSQLFVLKEDVSAVATNITFNFTKMNNPHTRLGIRELKFGEGIILTGEDISSITHDSKTNIISEELPSETATITIIDFDNKYNWDNPDSMVEYFEQGQQVDIEMGYYLDEYDDTSIEWFKISTIYITSWNYQNNILTLTCNDLFQNSNASFDGLKNVYITYYRMLEYCAERTELGIDRVKISEDLFDYTVENPIPMISIREIMQILCNSSASIMKFDSDGNLEIDIERIANYVLNTSNDYVDSSQLMNITEKNRYATYEKDTIKADGTAYFTPSDFSKRDKEWGYVSTDISDSSGNIPTFLGGANNDETFSTSSISLIFQNSANSKVSSFQIGFGLNIPKRITIKTYEITAEGNYIFVEQFEFDNNSKVFEFSEELQPFNEMLIEFWTTENPNNRVYVDYFNTDSVSDYYVTIDDMYELAMIDAEKTYKTANVVSTRYDNQTTEEQVYSKTSDSTTQSQEVITFSEPYYSFRGVNCTIVSYGDYAVKIKPPTTTGSDYSVYAKKKKAVYFDNVYDVNTKGSQVTFENPLISPSFLQKTKGYFFVDSLIDYYKYNKLYSLDWRGDLRIQVGDIIHIANRFQDDVLIKVEKNTLLYEEGVFKGKLEGRRIDDVDYTKN